MLRILLATCLLACSSASFNVASTDDAAVDTSADGTGADSPAPDTTVVPITCNAPSHTTTDVYVDAAAAAGGKGDNGCPFKTLAEAAAVPLGPGLLRTVHVAEGTYAETGYLRVRSGETYRGEPGYAKIAAGGAKCGPITATCLVLVEGIGALENFALEGPVDHELVLNGSPGQDPSARNVSVRNALSDGILVIGTSANLGPSVSSSNNAGDGLRMVGFGTLKIVGTGNEFNGSKAAAGAGIHMMSGALFVDGGTSTNSNSIGIHFDGTGNREPQTISQLTAENNRQVGLAIKNTWKNVTVRKSRFTKNAYYGVYAEFAADSKIDMGTTEAGNNIFGGVSTNNGRAGVFLCGASVHVFDGAKFSLCPPTSETFPNCEATLAGYRDVALVWAGATPPVVSAPGCTKGP
jgi:hypothetical protein